MTILSPVFLLFSPSPVRLAVQPASFEFADQPFAQLVVDYNEDCERDGRQPVDESHGGHTEDRGDEGHVDEEHSECRLEEQTEVGLIVLHSLLEQRETTGLADEDVCP